MSSETMIQYYTMDEAEKIIDFRRAREVQKKKEKTREIAGQKILGLALIGIGLVAPILIGDGTVSIVLVPMGLAVVFGRKK